MPVAFSAAAGAYFVDLAVRRRGGIDRARRIHHQRLHLQLLGAKMTVAFPWVMRYTRAGEPVAA